MAHPDKYGGVGMVQPSAFCAMQHAIEEERVLAIPSTKPVAVPMVQRDQFTRPKEVHCSLSLNIIGQLKRVLPPPPKQSEVVHMVKTEVTPPVLCTGPSRHYAGLQARVGDLVKVSALTKQICRPG